MSLAASGINAYPTGPMSGGKCYAYNNVGTSPAVVAPANTGRQSITFYNPGTNNIYIAPSNVQNLNNVPTSSNGQPNLSNVALTPSSGALGGCVLVGAGGGYFTFNGECAGSFQAFATSGSTNPLTVFDTNG